jgi:hypothetical protein
VKKIDCWNLEKKIEGRFRVAQSKDRDQKTAPAPQQMYSRFYCPLLADAIEWVPTAPGVRASFARTRASSFAHSTLAPTPKSASQEKNRGRGF